MLPFSRNVWCPARKGTPSVLFRFHKVGREAVDLCMTIHNFMHSLKASIALSLSQCLYMCLCLFAAVFHTHMHTSFTSDYFQSLEVPKDRINSVENPTMFH